MEIITMEYTKTIKITCKPEHLESYFYQKMASEGGNNGFAKLLGIHPSTASRDKSRIFKLACQVIAHYGLPSQVVSMPNSEPQDVVMTRISGSDIRHLINVLSTCPIKKLHSSANHEAFKCQMEVCI